MVVENYALDYPLLYGMNSGASSLKSDTYSEVPDFYWLKVDFSDFLEDLYR